MSEEQAITEAGGQGPGPFEPAIPQWCSGCKQTRTIECVREGCPTAARLAEEAHYALINTELLEALENVLWAFNNMSAAMPDGISSAIEDPRPAAYAAIAKARSLAAQVGEQ